MMKNLLLVDLVGTIIEGPGDKLGRFVNKPEDVVPFPEAKKLMQDHHDAGGMIAVVTNQGGISIGHINWPQWEEIRYTVDEAFDYTIDTWVVCSHHPTAPNQLERLCWCRKPKPGMLIAAALELEAEFGVITCPEASLMVGDMPEDEQAARAAGVPFKSAAIWRSGL